MWLLRAPTQEEEEKPTKKKPPKPPQLWEEDREITNLTEQYFEEYEEVRTPSSTETVGTRSPAAFSEEIFDDDPWDSPPGVKTIDLSRLDKRKNFDEPNLLFCSIGASEAPMTPRGCVVDWQFDQVQTPSSHHKVVDVDEEKVKKRYDGLHDSVDSPLLSKAQGDRSPNPIRTPSPAKRKESHRVRTQKLQDYATATVQRDDFFQAESRLHAWLICHGLGHHWGGISSLGAKKIADLALLTKEDMDDLGLSPDDRRKLNIRIN